MSVNSNIGLKYLRVCSASVSTLALSFGALPANAEPVSFNEAVARAVSTAPTIEARSLQVDAAESQLIPADQLPDPKVSVDLLDQRVAGPFEPSLRPGRDGFPRTRIGLSQEFPNGAKRRARMDQAQSDIEIAQAERSSEVQDIGLYTAMAWVELYYAGRRLNILDVLDQSLEELSATAAARLESGAARPAQAFEPERLKAKLADRRAVLIAETERAKANLTRWTDIDNPETQGDVPPIKIDRELLLAGLRDLPILAVEQARVARAEADINLARSEKRPDFGVNASFTQRRPEFGSYASIGVTVDLPIFAKKRQNPLINARMLDANAARLEAQDLERQLIAQLSGDLASNRALRENWERSRETLVPLAKRQAELERVSYGAGRIDLSTALNAAVALAEAEIDLLDREAAFVRDTVRIKFTYDRNLP